MTRPGNAALAASLGLALVGEALWLWSWSAAIGDPLLPARAVWVWPLVWVGCTASAWALTISAARLTRPGIRGFALAGGLISDLLGRVLLLGVPLLMCFFAAASVLAASGTQTP